MLCDIKNAEGCVIQRPSLRLRNQPLVLAMGPQKLMDVLDPEPTVAALSNTVSRK